MDSDFIWHLIQLHIIDVGKNIPEIEEEYVLKCSPSPVANPSYGSLRAIYFFILAKEGFLLPLE